MLSSKKIILYIFLGIYLSYIVFFDLRILTIRAGYSTPELSVLLPIWGAALLPFIFFYSLSIKVTKSNLTLLLLFYFYIIVSTIVGLARGNEIGDLVGDLLKSFFVPAGVGLYFVFRDNAEIVERAVYAIGSLFVVFRTLIFIFAMGSLSLLYFGTSMDALLVCLAIKTFNVDRKLNRGKYRAKITSLIVIAAALIGQKRTVLVAFLVYLVHKHTIALLIILAIGVFLFSSVDTIDWRSVPYIARYLSIIDTEFLLENQSMRIMEVTTAYSAWTSGTTVFVFGHGFGAEILVYTGRDDYAEALHSLHNTPMAVIYRSGLIGLLLLAYLLKIGVSGIISGRKSDGAIILALFVACFFFFSFIDEVFVGFFAAKILEGRNPKRRNTT